MVGSVSGPAIGMSLSPYATGPGMKTDRIDRAMYWWNYSYICTVAHHLLGAIWDDITGTHIVSSLRAQCTRKEFSHWLWPALENHHHPEYVQPFAHLPPVHLSKRFHCCEI